ncbi:hypothetical protein Dsin_008078 [Dipteronia sinensis]|uniref:RRM domain-containing protein n=1 Tax=Dipteronia sinensis TaxID=43782 RepID=A0AAE0EH78_9ROSI|nr:hypothetical protein Dsin_008078 [Dipteronia sinensis]
MERESFRERKTDSFSREGSQIATNGRASRKDFRDGLYSIFIDNLKPEVDSKVLWGFFKAFGRVRDVFLSGRSCHRRSRFAFVRFETWEKANKVANLANERNLRRWPIVSKMAAFGWKNRLSPALRLSLSRKVDGEASNVDDKANGDQKGKPRKLTFVEMVNGYQDRCNEECLKLFEKDLSMSWDMEDGEESWLARCVIGDLKIFSDVPKMNSHLCSKGYSFQSSYLGDKYFMWCFGSVHENEGFMNNKSLWEDYIDSMKKWSGMSISKSRLVWIMCWGAPLPCWNSRFFLKLGMQLGEPVYVEENTQSMRRLDRGRVLVLVPHEWKCPLKIDVVLGGKCFDVQISEEPTLVDSFWLEIFLGLILTGGPVKEEFQMEAYLNFTLEKESGCDMTEKGRVVVPFSSNVFGDADMFAVVDSILIRNHGKEKENQEMGVGFHKRRSDKDYVLKRSANSFRLKEGGERSTSEILFKKDQTKGNMVYVGKANLRLCFDYVGISKRKRGRKSLVSLKRHSMILRSFKACEKVKQQNFELNNKVTWNLEDEACEGA